MVNVKDIEEEKITGDMLEDIFTRQLSLLKKYYTIEVDTLPCIVTGTLPVDINSYKGQHQIKWRFMNCIVEICEAMDVMKNKAWKQSMVETDETHLKEEIADALHFFIEACILIGMDAEELWKFYFKKNKVNEFRQRSRY